MQIQISLQTFLAFLSEMIYLLDSFSRNEKCYVTNFNRLSNWKVIRCLLWVCFITKTSQNDWEEQDDVNQRL